MVTPKNAVHQVPERGPMLHPGNVEEVTLGSLNLSKVRPDAQAKQETLNAGQGTLFVQPHLSDFTSL